MIDIIGGILEAGHLIITGDPYLYGIVFRTLLFSGVAAILAALWGTPIAMLISTKEFRGKTFVKTFFNSLIGIPTVVLGLVLFLLLSKAGPFGFLAILYTPAGIILGEAILVTPILISIMITAIEAVDPDIMRLSKTLGASESQAQVTVLKEAVNGVILAVIASFNRAIAELGVALMVGGNIAGSTEVLTTAISRYTQTNDMGLAIALGLFLMLLVFIINIVIVIAHKVKTLFYGIDIPILNYWRDKHGKSS